MNLNCKYVNMSSSIGVMRSLMMFWDLYSSLDLLPTLLLFPLLVMWFLCWCPLLTSMFRDFFTPLLHPFSEVATYSSLSPFIVDSLFIGSKKLQHLCFVTLGLAYGFGVVSPMCLFLPFVTMMTQ